ncbi:MAG: pyridoxal phosphate-dependent aminotransferase family protein [Gemmatimonadetes bacterium]|nr:pyridoxal phosphate-dependent aminotransferase family protein [Gemmatimonadota bacterium]
MNTDTLQQVALFDKCSNFTQAREIKKTGLYPYFKSISKSNDTIVTIEGRDIIMMGSNNYLGLTHHPKVLEAARDALERYGSGCTGSRFLNGTLDLHGILEQRLAAFIGKESALVFSTGYQANLGLISALVGRNDVVLIDKLDHASIVDGAKMSYGVTERFRHGDMAQLESLLQKHSGKGLLIVVDGVYSMEGNIADLPALVDLAHRYGAALAVDDAHAIGVLGPNGEGTAAHFGLADEVDVIAGTFSKSLGSIGGYVAGTEEVIDYLKHLSRPLMFSAALPPANTAGVLAALEVMVSEPERRENLWKNTHKLQDGLKSLGYEIGASETPIVPVVIGELWDTFRFWRKVFDAGIFTNPVVPPAVPPKECRLRTSLMASHSDSQIDFALDTFAKLGKEVGII